MKSETYYLGTIVNRLRDELGVDVCSVYLTNPTGDQLILAATSGLNQSAIGARMSIRQGLTGLVARTRRSLSVKNPETHSDYYHVKDSGEEKYHSYLGIPLLQDNNLHGVLVVQTVRTKLFFMNEIKMLHEAGRRVIDVILETA